MWCNLSCAGRWFKSPQEPVLSRCVYNAVLLETVATSPRKSAPRPPDRIQGYQYRRILGASLQAEKTQRRGDFDVLSDDKTAREVAERWPSVTILVASGRMRPEPDELPPAAVFIQKPFSADVVHQRLLELLPDGLKPDRSSASKCDARRIH